MLLLNLLNVVLFSVGHHAVLVDVQLALRLQQLLQAVLLAHGRLLQDLLLGHGRTAFHQDIAAAVLWVRQVKTVIFIFVVIEIALSYLPYEGSSFIKVLPVHVLRQLLSICKASGSFVTQVEIGRLVIVADDLHFVLVTVLSVTIATKPSESSELPHSPTLSCFGTYLGREKATVGVLVDQLRAWTRVYRRHGASPVI